MWSDTEHVIANWDELQDFFFPLSLLGSSNSIIQMWGFHPVVDMHPALWLERQGCKCHLILLSHPPKMTSPMHFIVSVWKSICDPSLNLAILSMWNLELLRQWRRCFFKEESTLTSWRDLLMIFCNSGSMSCATVLHQQEKGGYEERLMTWSACS